MADEDGPNITIQYLDGENEKAKWINRAGKALVTYENGEIYEGFYNKNGEKHGYGEYTYKVHDDEEDADKIGTYKGNWQQGRKHGKGHMIYPNGESYNGMWYRNNKDGQGTYIYKNGDVYSGQWVQDKKEGKGTLYNPKLNYQLVGLWKNNQLIRGKWIMEDGTIYNGFFDYNKPVGKGVFSFPNGFQVEGTYDKKHLKPGEEEEEETVDETDENYTGVKRFWYPNKVVVKGAESTEINRAETDPIDYIPIYREVQYLKVETMENFNDREIVTIYNEGLTDANIKGCNIGKYKFRNDHILISGHRIRLLSGRAFDEPPLEYKDIQNIIWGKEMMWNEDKTPELWYINEEGERIVIHKLGETTNYELYQIAEMKRLQELEQLRIQMEIEEKRRQEEEIKRKEEEEAREKELAELAEAKELEEKEEPPPTEETKPEEGNEDDEDDDEDDDE